MRTRETVYLSGKDYFAGLFSALDEARTSIKIETYIFQSGQLTQTLLLKLGSAAARGVKVELLVDAAGSFGEIQKLEEQCDETGIYLRVYHPIVWSNLIATFQFLNRRNHRKLCIVDTTVAFVGSMNMSDVHVVETNTTKAWKDYGVAISGPEVATLILAFERIFYKKNFVSKIQQLILDREGQDVDEEGVILNDTRRKKIEAYERLLSLIRRAKKRIWLANAYIVPEFKLQKHLEAAARRGVDVRLLTSGNSSDVFFMPWLTRLYYQRNINAGVLLYEYLPAFFHGKVFIVDEEISVGSSNLNHRSVFHDLELDVVVLSKENKKKVVDDVVRCFLESKLIGIKDLVRVPYWQLLIARMLYVFKYWF